MVPQFKSQINARGAEILLNGNKTGCHVRNQMLVRRARGGREMMRKWNGRQDPAWSFHTAVIDQALEQGCAALLVIDDDTGRTYFTEMQTLLTYGQRFDFGHGAQIRLALRHWRQDAPAAAATTPAAVSRETLPQLEPQAAQMTLFGEVRS